MRAILLAFPLLFAPRLQAQAGPDPARIKAMHDQIKAKVLDPASLAALGRTAFGCRPDEEGARVNDFTTAARGSQAASVNPQLQSPVLDANPIPGPERPPRYYAQDKRPSADTFVFLNQAGQGRRVAELAGKAAVVFLFKPDCKYTPDLMGEIIRLHGMQKGKAYEVVPVSIGSEGWSGLARWRQLNTSILPADFPIYRPGLQAGTGASVFGELFGTPTTLILDRHGRVAWRINGAIRGALADRLNHILLEGLLETLPAAVASG